MGDFKITESNLKQILDLQQECYSKRIGNVYGDFKVVDVRYDWENHRQVWELKCVKCGITKITHNGKDYVKGKNKGICLCDKNNAREVEQAAKLKRRNNAPDNPKWIGAVFGNWKVLSYAKTRGWLVECLLCGRKCYHSAGRVKSDKPVLCTCQTISEFRNPEYIGKRFGHLVVQRYTNKGYLECLCDCGNVCEIKGSFLVKGAQVTCGVDCKYHLDNVITHGMSKERLYRIWRGMKERCYNPKSQHYRTYGGRGIHICDEWKENISAFAEWALSNGYADDLSIDRIDNDKGYSPENCRWATAKEQANNQHPRWTFTPKVKGATRKSKTWVIDGVEKSIKEWCSEYGFTVTAVLYRVNTKGMTPKEALTTPKSQGVQIN